MLKRPTRIDRGFPHEWEHADPDDGWVYVRTSRRPPHPLLPLLLTVALLAFAILHGCGGV